MMKDYQTIVDFSPLADADRRWHRWLQENDVGCLAAEDVLIDTGHGERDGRPCTIRRYRIVKDKLVLVKPRVKQEPNDCSQR